MKSEGEKKGEKEMKKLLAIIISGCCAFALYFGANVGADEKEKEAAKVPLENYLKGHATGNPEFMRKAFHTEGKLIFIRDGKYTTRTFEEYIAGMKDGKPAADEAKRKRWIESVEVAGNAAVGKIILDYPTVKFIDYMTMLKIDGEWKIVNKSFYAEPKAPPAK
jgi:hypothetical protein